MKTTLLAAVLAAGLAVPAVADRADDDLAAVKKAVSGGSAQVARTEAPARPRSAVEQESPAERPAPAAGPKWFRVRVVEKNGKRGRVSVNLPLGLVRAFGEDWPLAGCRHCQGGRGPTLGEILRSLDSGQSLVEIEDDDATVRVWVD